MCKNQEVEFYSVLDHICWGLLLNRDSPLTVVAALTEFSGYFDDGGHPDDQPAVIVAGFVGTKEQWLIFEREWMEILSPLGIEQFHMTDFETCRVWSRRKKDEILSKLVSVIRERIRRPISATVLMQDYKELNDSYTLEQSIGTPFAIAGRTVAASLNTWKAKYANPSDPLIVFYERGTKHYSDFEEAMKRDRLPLPIPAGKEVVPLQAADLLAWELLYSVKKRKIRESLRKLLWTDEGMGIIRKPHLEEMCKHPTVRKYEELTPDYDFSYWTSPKRKRRRTIGPPRK